MRHNNIRRMKSTIMTGLAAACAFFTVAMLLIILGYITMRGITSINLQFLIDTPKPAGEGGGIGNAILGSFVLVAVACSIGLPLGIAAGVYLAEIGNNWFASIIRFVADTLTGVPSIVVGVFVYTLIVLPMKHFSAMAGAVSLALIMIPIVTRTTEEMIRLVPTSMREGALALGAPQWRVTMGVVLPAAAPGIATGAMLAIARVSGETAPLLFTALGSRFFDYYLDQPIASLPVLIYSYATQAPEELHKQAWAATLVLMTIILLINITVRFLVRRKF